MSRGRAPNQVGLLLELVRDMRTENSRDHEEGRAHRVQAIADHRQIADRLIRLEEQGRTTLQRMIVVEGTVKKMKPEVDRLATIRRRALRAAVAATLAVFSGIGSGAWYVLTHPAEIRVALAKWL